MNVSSVGSAYLNPQTQAVQQTAQTAAVSKGSGDSDGDSDGSGAQAVQTAPKPTVNMNGQKIGQLINVTA